MWSDNGLVGIRYSWSDASVHPNEVALLQCGVVASESHCGYYGLSNGGTRPDTCLAGESVSPLCGNCLCPILINSVFPDTRYA